MRGGRVFIRDGCGWRAGIHMKQYGERRPVVVVGKDAGSFLGEYMAGGVFVVLGETGDCLARGMHGGVIYLRRPPRGTRCRMRSCSRASTPPTSPSWCPCLRSTTSCSQMSWVAASRARRRSSSASPPCLAEAVREHVRSLTVD